LFGGDDGWSVSDGSDRDCWEKGARADYAYSLARPGAAADRDPPS